MDCIRLINTKSPNIDLTRKYSTKEYSLKPHGLWYSINEEWVEWCKSNEPHWIHKHSFVIELDHKNMCVISNEEELMKFNQKYTIFMESFAFIDWKKVKKDFKGIEIRNYWEMHEYRFEPDYIWFYGLDASSGCIWNLTAVKSILPYELKVKI